MAIGKGKNEDSNWMSYSDMMTGLMVIFMFIALSYMINYQDKKKQRDLIFEEFKNTKENIYSELKKEFKEDFKKWQVILDKDLSIKFTNPDVLFSSGKATIRKKFKDILNDFFPRYFDVILQAKYIDNINEIRIEGHTDRVPAPQYDADTYIGNIKLSQLRSAEVLKYFREMDYYTKLPYRKKNRLQFWITANGLSYGRTVDKEGKLTNDSKEPIDNKRSRRVEFKILTNSEEIVEQVIKQIQGADN